MLAASPGKTTNQPITVTASGCGGTVNWAPGGGTGVANGNRYTFTAPGSYTLSAICTQNNCPSLASTPLSLTINPAVNNVNCGPNGQNVKVCYFGVSSVYLRKSPNVS